MLLAVRNKTLEIAFPMCPDEESVSAWLDQLQAGESVAAEKIWQRYVADLIRLARRKLCNTPLRSGDEEDVVLAAFDGFLKSVEEGRFPELENRNDLWQILVMLTERRAVAFRRRELAAKRGGGRVRGESVFDWHECGDSNLQALDQFAGREPAPDFAVEMTHRLRELLDRLSCETQRRIVLGKLEGRTNEELASQLGISVRTVERKLGIIRDKWQGEISDE